MTARVGYRPVECIEMREVSRNNMANSPQCSTTKLLKASSQATMPVARRIDQFKRRPQTNEVNKRRRLRMMASKETEETD